MPATAMTLALDAAQLRAALKQIKPSRTPISVADYRRLRLIVRNYETASLKAKKWAEITLVAAILTPQLLEDALPQAKSSRSTVGFLDYRRLRYLSRHYPAACQHSRRWAASIAVVLNPAILQFS